MDKDIDGHGDRDELDHHDELDELDDAVAPWLPAGYAPPRNATRRRGRRAAALAATALVAAAAGFAVVTAVLGDPTASPTAASASPAAPGATPGGSAPGGAVPGGGAGNQLQPGSGAIPTPGPGQGLRLAIGGKVAAVSATSITLGSPGRYVTAAVTRATRVTGKVTAISGVKVGDLVTAQITGTDGKLTATAIQDPASLH